MADQELVNDACTQYASRRVLYAELCQKIASILSEVIRDQGIVVHSITAREKDLESFRNKASLDKYQDPISQIKDLAGIRVITYVDSDARKVAAIISDLFSVDSANSDDAGLRLGVDRVGYRSVHFVCQLPENRTTLLEYRRFATLDFEVQVRTILQHAWAEIEHDRRYKFAGVLPSQIQRRFGVLAGVLELADREFDELARSIDEYGADVAAKTEAGQLDIAIDTTSLREFMLSRFQNAVKAGLSPIFGPTDDNDSEVIGELTEFGIATLSDLDAIIPPDLASRVDVCLDGGDNNFLGLLRGIMMIYDSDTYFQQAWQQHWGSLGSGPMLAAYGVDTNALKARYGV